LTNLKQVFLLSGLVEIITNQQRTIRHIVLNWPHLSLTSMKPCSHLNVGCRWALIERLSTWYDLPS